MLSEKSGTKNSMYKKLKCQENESVLIDKHQQLLLGWGVDYENEE